MMDVTGLVGCMARLVGHEGPGPWVYVVVGGFLNQALQQVAHIVESESSPHLILLDAEGRLLEYPIDLVQIQVAVEADDAPGAEKAVAIVPVRQ